jgi:hypothetical protein
MTSEIQTRAPEIRNLASKCSTINELAKSLGWNMETARHANTVLELNLPDARLQTGPRTEAKANPKQPKKAGK